jgi:hypothetical protein
MCVCAPPPPLPPPLLLCSVPVGGAYVSYRYEDELVWAAAWLYRATGDAVLLSTAETRWAAHLWCVPAPPSRQAGGVPADAACPLRLCSVVCPCVVVP